MDNICKLWGEPLNIVDSLPADPKNWPMIITLKPAHGVLVLFYQTENGNYKLRVCVDDFEPISFKPFELKNIANVTKCFLIPPGSWTKNYTLSVSRPGDPNEQIKLTVATPGDIETASPSSAPAKPKKNHPRNRNKGSSMASRGIPAATN